MRRILKATGRPYKRGVIAIEAALVLPILLLFIGFPSILYAYYFRQYTAVQKAAHDAAIYLSTAPKLEMTTAGMDGNFAALTLAKRIVEKELAGIVPDGTSVDPNVNCYYRVASSTKGTFCTPQTFKLPTYTLIKFDVTVAVPFMDPLTGKEVESMYMSTIATVAYMGD